MCICIIYSYISNYGDSDNYQDPEGISQWTDLAKIVCDGISSGPRPRPVPHKETKLKIFLGGFDTSVDSDPLLRSSVESDEVCINFIIFTILIELMIEYDKEIYTKCPTNHFAI